MTVQQLIEKLSQFDSDADVQIMNIEGDVSNIHDIDEKTPMMVSICIN